MPWRTVRATPAGEETACWWCGRGIVRGAEAHVLVPTYAEPWQKLPELCSPGCAKRYADYAPPEVMAAAVELGRLREDGATLDDVLNGEAGRRWTEDACAGDEELARAALRLVHPGAAFVDDPLALAEEPERGGEGR